MPIRIHQAASDTEEYINKTYSNIKQLEKANLVLVSLQAEGKNSNLESRQTVSDGAQEHQILQGTLPFIQEIENFVNSEKKINSFTALLDYIQIFFNMLFGLQPQQIRIASKVQHNAKTFINNTINILNSTNLVEKYSSIQDIEDQLSQLSEMKKHLIQIRNECQLPEDTANNINTTINYQIKLLLQSKVFSTEIKKYQTVRELNRVLDQIYQIKENCVTSGLNSAEIISNLQLSATESLKEAIQNILKSTIENSSSIEEIKEKISKFDIISQRIEQLFYHEDTEISGNETSQQYLDDFTEFYNTASAIFQLVNDEIISDALLIKSPEINEQIDDQRVSDNVEKYKNAITRCENFTNLADTLAMKCINTAKTELQTKKEEYEMQVVYVKGIQNVMDEFPSLEDVGTDINASKILVNMVTDTLEHFTGEKIEKFFHEVLTQEQKEVLISAIQCVTTKITNNPQITTEDINLLAKLSTLSETFPQIISTTHIAIINHLHQISQISNNGNYQNKPNRSTMSCIVNFVIMHQADVTNTIPVNQFIDILQIINLAKIRLSNSNAHVLNQWGRQYLSNKIDTSEHFQNFLKEAKNVKIFTLISTFLLSNEKEKGLKNINDFNNLDIGKITRDQTGNILKSGTKVTSGGQEITIQNTGLLGRIADFDEKNPDELFKVNLLLSILELTGKQSQTINKYILDENKECVFTDGTQPFIGLQMMRLILHLNKNKKLNAEGFFSIQKQHLSRLQNAINNNENNVYNIASTDIIHLMNRNLLTLSTAQQVILRAEVINQLKQYIEILKFNVYDSTPKSIKEISFRIKFLTKLIKALASIKDNSDTKSLITDGLIYAEKGPLVDLKNAIQKQEDQQIAYLEFLCKPNDIIKNFKNELLKPESTQSKSGFWPFTAIQTQSNFVFKKEYQDLESRCAYYDGILKQMGHNIPEQKIKNELLKLNLNPNDEISFIEQFFNNINSERQKNSENLQPAIQQFSIELYNLKQELKKVTPQVIKSNIKLVIEPDTANT